MGVVIVITLINVSVSKTVEEYIQTNDVESRLQLGHDMKKIQLAFEIMKVIKTIK